MRRSLIASLLLLVGVAAPNAAGAETFNTCAGFIDTLPATISTQGVWCLRSDLSTAITTGNAITINTNNVTIDCNDFKIGGLAAGAGTSTSGVYAGGRVNATVRRCNIRGFLYGVLLDGGLGGGHVIENNRFNGNTYIGVSVAGDGSVVQRNQVTDTGGSTVSTADAYAIYTADAVDVLDNTVSGVLPTDGTANGIFTYFNPSGSIAGNRVRGMVPQGTGQARGIFNLGSGRISLRDNDLSGDGSAGSIGLYCDSFLGRARGNIVNGYETAISGCSGTTNEVVP